MKIIKMPTSQSCGTIAINYHTQGSKQGLAGTKCSVIISLLLRSLNEWLSSQESWTFSKTEDRCRTSQSDESWKCNLYMQVSCALGCHSILILKCIWGAKTSCLTSAYTAYDNSVLWSICHMHTLRLEKRSWHLWRAWPGRFQGDLARLSTLLTGRVL